MLSIKEIKADFDSRDKFDIQSLIDFKEKYSSDERSGVVSLITRADKLVAAINKEKERIYAMTEYERRYQGEYEYICGIDEVGRGPLAGPVVAGAVILPRDCEILYLNDSKQLSAGKREELTEIIKEKAVAWATAEVSHEIIDEINILNATYEAMRRAIAALGVKPDFLLNDAVTIPGVDMGQCPIIKGDAKSVSIAAASIVAKVTRDAKMEEYDKLYPGYGFASNKGYGSSEHIKAIKELGPCPIHRRSFISNIVS
ncbi:MAG: ribonuclease HII [Lachnospiraceae bacterium]|nr:ribonuclease HII [Lachnospiraceae bacterium]